MGVLCWLVASVPVVMWVGLLLLPWQPWRTRERIEADPSAGAQVDLGEITVLIPARNEAQVIGATQAGLQIQGSGLQVLVIDDQSDDATAQIAAAFPNTRVITGQPPPDGWSGKLWALEQARRTCTRH